MGGDRLTDDELAACKEKAGILREMAERLGNDYSALNHEKIVRALTELQERRKPPVTSSDDGLANLLWYAREAACHSDPNYCCEFQRLAAPSVIAEFLDELQERRKAEPALYCMVVDGRIDPEYASLSRAVVAAWVDEWVAAKIGHKYELVELYKKGGLNV